MGLTISQWNKSLWVIKYAWFIGERIEKNIFIEEYELDGIRYELFFENKSFNTSIKNTGVLVALVEMPA